MATRRNRSSLFTRGSRQTGLLEGLESRLLMAAHIWTGAVSSNWSDAGNWTGGAPAPAEVDCDLEFPDGALQPMNFNDIVGLSVRNITVTGDAANGLDYFLSLTNGTIISGSLTVNAGLDPVIGGAAQLFLSQDLTVDVAATSNLTLSATVNGPQALTKIGGGTLTLSPSVGNNYSGISHINVGTVVITKDGSLGIGTIDIVAGATLALGGSGSRQIIRAMSVAGDGVGGAGAIQLLDQTNWTFTNTVAVSAPASISTVAGRTLTISGVLIGNDNLTQLGTGTLALTGGGAYTGTLTVSGSLVVSSNLSSMNVDVPAGTVSGTGRVAALSLTGGTVSPAGAAVGTLAVEGGLSMDATSTAAMDIAAADSSDLIDVTGAVNLNGALSITILNSFAPTIGTSFTLISNDGADAVTGTFTGLAEGDDFVLNGKTFQISYAGGDGNDVVIARVAANVYAVGTDAGTVATVKVFNNNGDVLFPAIRPYGTTFKGGVTVATGDLNGDGIVEIVVAPLAGTVPLVKIYSSDTGALLSSFNPGYTTLYRGGLYIAVGDVNNDGDADIVVAPKSGQSGTVKVFSGTDNSQLGASFKAYSATYGGGVRVAVGDVNGDGNADIITAPGNSTFKTIKVFSGADYTQKLQEFTPYKNTSNVPVGFGAGMFVAAGDFNGDGLADIVTAPGSGGKGQVKLFDADDLVTPAVLGTASPYGTTWAYGVRLAVQDVNNDGTADLLTMPGATGKSALKIYDGADLTFATLLNGTPVRVFAAPYNGGGFVG